ncbi:hypothetical protein AV530_014512 [Patagioenas fasciata monilis]|uniref:Uncharacterized protein n=1 Tax=Patagioenas fasciata monilis TaxID=372326 RepID=A0A1V4KC10_PATFA|nr:hypothetical protein AV530_014512 [Patagioenas fasciata monilis]
MKTSSDSRGKRKLYWELHHKEQAFYGRKMNRVQEQVSPSSDFGDYLKTIRKIQEEEQEEDRNESSYCLHKKATQNEANTHLAVKETVFCHVIYYVAQPEA